MKTIMHSLWTALLSFLLLSCGNDAQEREPSVSAEQIRVAFLLQMEKSDGGDFSSEAGSHRSSIGNDVEGRIKKETLKIFIYEELPYSIEYVGEVEHLVFFPHPESNGGPTAVYHFEGQSSVPLQPGTTYRFIVVANVEGVTAMPTGEGFTFEYSGIQYPDGHLPLWGVTSHTVDYQPLQYLPPIHLLRGVAKVKVRLSDELKQKGYDLREVTLSRCALRGYAFPKEWYSSRWTDDLVSESDIFHPYPLPATDIISQPLVRGRGENPDYFLYVPEYDHESAGGEALLSLTLAGNGTEEHYADAIAFKHYVKGVAQENTRYNLLRNRTYEFVIVGVDIGHHLSLECSVQPWTLEEETWDYTDHVTVRSEGKMQWVKGTYSQIEQATGTVVMKPGISLVCNFQIDTPKEAFWHASFIPVSGNADGFRFETNAINEGKNATGKVGLPVSLHIRSVSPAVTRNNVVQLRVVVITKGGRTILVKNLLPDEFQNIVEYTIVQPK